MKVGVAHTGARDGYQVALAHEERQSLSLLVTSGCASGGIARIIQLLPHTGGMLQRRHIGILSEHVRPYFFVDLMREAGRALGSGPQLSRAAEAIFGLLASRATSDCDVVIAYNYVAQYVLPRARGRGVLFQCHPNPAALNQVFQEFHSGVGAENTVPSGFELEREIAWGARYRAALFSEWKSANAVIAPSTYVRDSLVSAGCDPSRIVVIPYGCRSSAAQLAKSNISGRRPRILFVGQLVWRKGADILAKVAQALEDKADVFVVTRGLLDACIVNDLQRCANVSIFRNISREELEKVYSHCDIFFLPSRFEGYGLVLNEAIASGLPVISTTSTGLPDMLQYGAVGRIVASESADDCIETISDLAFGSTIGETSSEALRVARILSWEKFRMSVYDTSRSVHESSL